jgi:hypothetical protein
MHRIDAHRRNSHIDSFVTPQQMTDDTMQSSTFSTLLAAAVAVKQHSA